MKYIEANCACGGYEDIGFAGFRLYQAHDATNSGNVQSSLERSSFENTEDRLRVSVQRLHCTFCCDLGLNSLSIGWR